MEKRGACLFRLGGLVGVSGQKDRLGALGKHFLQVPQLYFAGKSADVALHEGKIGEGRRDLQIRLFQGGRNPQLQHSPGFESFEDALHPFGVCNEQDLGHGAAKIFMDVILREGRRIINIIRLMGAFCRQFTCGRRPAGRRPILAPLSPACALAR